MKVRILGTSGGIGAQTRTTSLLVDQVPGREDDITHEIARHIPHNALRQIERGQVFEL